MSTNGTKLLKKADPYPQGMRCQKCLEMGHWSYECKNKRKYLYRSSCTSLLKKALEKQKADNTKANIGVTKKKREMKKREISSNDSSSSSSESSSSSSESSSSSSSDSESDSSDSVSSSSTSDSSSSNSCAQKRRCKGN